MDRSGKIRESEQDIAYMMALLKRGVDDATIKGRVQSERTDWHNHKGETRAEHYLAETLKKAKAFVGSSGYTVDIFDQEKKLSSKPCCGKYPFRQGP
ncbi:MAG: hypothetical protein VR64_14730 [Desulfatitalea sp. BRH_c12]|nr:MAG: hypothetical protein VR64_14730 [Desulfatitalea sp. BRH_c12]